MGSVTQRIKSRLAGGGRGNYISLQMGRNRVRLVGTFFEAHQHFLVVSQAKKEFLSVEFANRRECKRVCKLYARLLGAGHKEIADMFKPRSVFFWAAFDLANLKDDLGKTRCSILRHTWEIFQDLDQVSDEVGEFSDPDEGSDLVIKKLRKKSGGGREGRIGYRVVAGKQHPLTKAQRRAYKKFDVDFSELVRASTTDEDIAKFIAAIKKKLKYSQPEAR